MARSICRSEVLEIGMLDVLLVIFKKKLFFQYLYVSPQWEPEELVGYAFAYFYSNQ